MEKPEALENEASPSQPAASPPHEAKLDAAKPDAAETGEQGREVSGPGSGLSAAPGAQDSLLDALGGIGAPAWVLVTTLTLMQPGLLVVASTVITLVATVLFFTRGFVRYQPRLLPLSWVGPLLLCLSSAGIGAHIFGSPFPGTTPVAVTADSLPVTSLTLGVAGGAEYPFWLNSILRAAWVAWFQTGIGCLLMVALFLSPQNARLRQELEKGIRLPLKGWWLLPLMMLVGSVMVVLYQRALPV